MQSPAYLRLFEIRMVNENKTKNGKLLRLLPTKMEKENQKSCLNFWMRQQQLTQKLIQTIFSISLNRFLCRNILTLTLE